MKSGKINIDWQFKRALKEADITLKVLERATGINHALLSMYGNGKYNLNPIERRKIARALGMPESKIFSN